MCPSCLSTEANPGVETSSPPSSSSYKIVFKCPSFLDKWRLNLSEAQTCTCSPVIILHIKKNHTTEYCVSLTHITQSLGTRQAASNHSKYSMDFWQIKPAPLYKYKQCLDGVTSIMVLCFIDLNYIAYTFFLAKDIMFWGYVYRFWDFVQN